MHLLQRHVDYYQHVEGAYKLVGGGKTFTLRTLGTKGIPTSRRHI